MLQNRHAFIDWLSFTLPNCQSSWRWIEGRLGGWLENDKGFLGYPDSANTEIGALLGWNAERSDVRIYVVLSAKALFMLQEFHVTYIIRSAINAGAKFTRIDIAKDDIGEESGILDLNEIASKIQRRELVTRWRVWSRIVSGPISGHSDFFGDTIYLGNREGQSFLRIYNKAGQTGSSFHWIRCELELKGDKAISLSREIYKETANLADILFYLIRFKDKSNLAKKTQWLDSPFWLDFLETCKGQKLELPRYETGLEDVTNWMNKQVSASLTLLQKLDKLKPILETGKQKFDENPRLQRLANMNYESIRKETEQKRVEKLKIFEWRYLTDLKELNQ